VHATGEEEEVFGRTGHAAEKRRWESESRCRANCLQFSRARAYFASVPSR
jgi:hypothetical protein